MSKKLKAVAGHCLNSDEELAELLTRTTGTKDPVKAGSRGEILSLLNQLETKISAFRQIDNDDQFLDNIDGKLRSLLDGIDTPEKSEHSITRSLRFR